jgi:photosystem II stability/assembly factor-like uncharacterized protein
MAPGGEGTQIQVDPVSSNIVYSSSFYGRLMKTDMSKGRRDGIKRMSLFDVGRIDSLRAEWLAGTLMSKFDNKVIYHGLQHLYKTEDAGETWKRISNDLSHNKESAKGVYPYLIYHQAITAIAEGDQSGTLVAGTDDGRVWLTINDGNNWKEITNNLPKNKHVAKLFASSNRNPPNLYLALNDRRQDNDSTYLYKLSADARSWQMISSNLPLSPVNVIIEDPEVNGVLYCGTDMGVYMSKDAGKSWIAINGNLPSAVSVNDMFIHPRDKKLVIGTYGSGVYVLDDISKLR